MFQLKCAASAAYSMALGSPLELEEAGGEDGELAAVADALEDLWRVWGLQSCPEQFAGFLSPGLTVPS